MYNHLNTTKVICRGPKRCAGCDELIKRRSQAKHVRLAQEADTAYREATRWRGVDL